MAAMLSLHRRKALFFWLTSGLGALLVGVLGYVSPALAGPDLLDFPARQSAKAARVMLLGVTRAGAALVAVGEHGVIVRSDDNGKTWQQAVVPVSVTLTAVHFPTADKGWAVGHDGVILASDDGGKKWRRQFDGNKANVMVLAAAQKRFRLAQRDNVQKDLKDAENGLEDAKAGAKFGPSRPFFDVWFNNATEGIVVGSFGQIFHTGDGGRTWALWSGRLVNPEGLHLNAISATKSGALMVAAEAGKVFRSDDAGVSWATQDTGYAGQLYGVRDLAGKDGQEVLLAFGFGGRLFRSADRGRHWLAVPGAHQNALVAGVVLAGGGVILASQDGKLLRSDDSGQSVNLLANGANMNLAGAALTVDGQLALCGSNGVRLVPVPLSVPVPGQGKRP